MSDTRLREELSCTGGDPETFTQAVARLEAASAAGSGEATALIATIESVGAGRPQSWSRSLDALQLAAEQGSYSARCQLQVLAKRSERDDWRALRGGVDIDGLLTAPEPVSLRDDPRVRSASGFATHEECGWIIDAARKKLRPAEVWDKQSRSGVRDYRRSNSSMEFRLFDLDVVIQVVRARIATITKLPVPLFEVPQVLHYSVGEEFEPHHDYFEPNEPGNTDHLASLGQRIATFLLYLNDEFEGGETEFPLAGMSYRGRTGDALFFANVNRAAEPDPRTLHSGRPPTAGEKWIFSQWIRARSPIRA